MPFSRRRILGFGGLAGAAALVSAATPVAILLNQKGRTERFLLKLGGKAWWFKIQPEGEPFLSVVGDYAYLQFQEGPWRDGSQGKLLVGVKYEGVEIEGNDIEIVQNERWVLGTRLENLLVLPGEVYDIDHGKELARRYRFFQPHS